jgi:hypothetical protein
MNKSAFEERKLRLIFSSGAVCHHGISIVHRNSRKPRGQCTSQLVKNLLDPAVDTSTGMTQTIAGSLVRDRVDHRTALIETQGWDPIRSATDTERKT